MVLEEIKAAAEGGGHGHPSLLPRGRTSRTPLLQKICHDHLNRRNMAMVILLSLLELEGQTSSSLEDMP